MSVPFGTHPMPATAGKLSEDNRLKLLGLAALAERHQAMLRDIHEAVAGIVGEPWGANGRDADYSCDFVYDNKRFTVEELWRLTADVREGRSASERGVQ